MLTVTTQKLEDGLILRCRGRIVRGEETALLCSAASQDGTNVVLDLSEVEAIDAAGIGALISLQAAGIYLTITNPTQRVREILRVTKLDSIFEIRCSELSGKLKEATSTAPADYACHATAG